MPAIVSSDLVRDWAVRALTALGESRAEIDALNVFPVPDGDTGTNLYLTMESACEGVQDCWTEDAPDVEQAARAMSTGALMGARGNSGVILSQILRGTGEILSALPDGSVLVGADVHRLLARAADLGYEAVARPVEGTILTVARAAADAAGAIASAGSDDAVAVVQAAVDGARDALARTPSMLESLRLAGVVDAGGAGPGGGPRGTGPGGVRGAGRCRRRGAHRVAHRGGRGGRHPHYGGPAYEVMFLLEADEAHVRRAEVAGSTRSATASSSSGATACGTSTSMSTTPARRWRRPWRRAGRTASASPTSSR